jgi:hypothetical protein
VIYNENISANYMLKTTFDYEIRNYIDVRSKEINEQEENSEEELDEQRLLAIVREYLTRRIGELKVHG